MNKKTRQYKMEGKTKKEKGEVKRKNKAIQKN